MTGNRGQKKEWDREETQRVPDRSVYNDWGLYSFAQMLIYKCQKNGKDLQIVDERNTSKMCSQCGNMQPMPLHKRTYGCPNCRMILGRDEKSAIQHATSVLPLCRE